jgi:hypothetical protein
LAVIAQLDKIMRLHDQGHRFDQRLGSRRQVRNLGNRPKVVGEFGNDIVVDGLPP